MFRFGTPRDVLEGGGGGASETQKFVYQKWPDQIFSMVSFVFTHYGHFRFGGGGPPSLYGVQQFKYFPEPPPPWCPATGMFLPRGLVHWQATPLTKPQHGRTIFGLSVRVNRRQRTPTELKTDANRHTPSLTMDANRRSLQVLCCALTSFAHSREALGTSNAPKWCRVYTTFGSKSLRGCSR